MNRKANPGPIKAEPTELAPSLKRREVAFSVQLRPEPLRDPVHRGLKPWDGLVWGTIMVLALVGIHLFITFERGAPEAVRADPKVQTAAIVEKARTPTRVGQVSLDPVQQDREGRRGSLSGPSK